MCCLYVLYNTARYNLFFFRCFFHVIFVSWGLLRLNFSRSFYFSSWFGGRVIPVHVWLQSLNIWPLYGDSSCWKPFGLSVFGREGRWRGITNLNGFLSRSGIASSHNAKNYAGFGSTDWWPVCEAGQPLVVTCVANDAPAIVYFFVCVAFYCGTVLSTSTILGDLSFPWLNEKTCGCSFFMTINSCFQVIICNVVWFAGRWWGVREGRHLVTVGAWRKDVCIYVFKF